MLYNIVSLNDSKTYEKLALWYYSNQKYKETLKYLKKSLELDPDNLGNHLFISKIYELTGFNLLAIDHLEILQQSDKKNWSIINNLIILYLQEKEYKKAAVLLSQRIHWLKGDLNWWTRIKSFVTGNNEIKKEYNRVIFQLVYSYREIEDYDLALKFGKMLTRNSKDPIPHYLLATIYECLSDYSNAEKEFAFILKRYTSFSPLFYEEIYNTFKENLLIPKINIS